LFNKKYNDISSHQGCFLGFKYTKKCVCERNEVKRREGKREEGKGGREARKHP